MNSQLPPLRHSVADAARILGLSIAVTYKRIQRGDLHTHKDGGRQYVTHTELLRYIAACESASAEPSV